MGVFSIFTVASHHNNYEQNLNTSSTIIIMGDEP